MTVSTSEISTLSSVAHAAASACQEAGAHDTQAFAMRHQNRATDYMIVCTATSALQAAAINKKLEEWLSLQSIEVLSARNRRDESGWIIIDCGFMCIHIMQREIRSYYELERLWLRDQML